MGIVPADKGDMESCGRLAAASDEEVIVVISELLEWLQDMNWPVANSVRDRIKVIREPLIEPLNLILSGNDESWKWFIVESLLRNVAPEVISGIKKELVRIHEAPRKAEIDEKVWEEVKEFLDESRKNV